MEEQATLSYQAGTVAAFNDEVRSENIVPLRGIYSTTRKPRCEAGVFLYGREILTARSESEDMTTTSEDMTTTICSGMIFYYVQYYQSTSVAS